MIALAAIAAFLLFVIIRVVNSCLLICHPNEVIILSGRRRKLSNGLEVGYRILRGGRALRIPVIEKAARMSLETMPVALTVRNAYSKGNIPLNVEAIANVKIDSTEPAFGNAVERFLDKALKEVHLIAKDTLEGNLRGVLATLTPEEVNEDRLKFAQSLIAEADNDLKQLGLQLDTLKIQNVSDEAGYLDALGRQKTAEVLSTARKAEAEQTAAAQQAEAIAMQLAEVAKANAQQEVKTAQIEADRKVKTANAIADAAARTAEAEQQSALEQASATARERAEVAKAKAEQEIRAAQIEAQREVEVTRAVADQAVEVERNNLRMRKAELERDAVVKEMEASVAGEKAKAQYEQEMEAERIVLQQKRLMADVIEPARAKREAMEEEAKGEAATILENGQAQLRVLKEMIVTYHSANGDGEKIFMLNMLPDVIAKLADTVNRVTIDKVSVIDAGGNGSGVGRFVNQFPAAVLSVSEQIENATGINILRQFGGAGAAPRPFANGVPADSADPTPSA
jgi:flotillin